MVDMSQTIAPKSDQLNADDLIGRTLTVKITKVSGCPEPQQPIAVNFEGDNGKPFKPCKSMRRVMVQVWGKDGLSYAGKSMTLYRDPKVLFGGMAVGGIRISHMSDIKDPITLALTESKTSRKPFTVKPLVVQREPAPLDVDELLGRAGESAGQGSAEYQVFWKGLDREQRAAILGRHESLKAIAKAADEDTAMMPPPTVENELPREEW